MGDWEASRRFWVGHEVLGDRAPGAIILILSGPYQPVFGEHHNYVVGLLEDIGPLQTKLYTKNMALIILTGHLRVSQTVMQPTYQHSSYETPLYS